MKIERVDENKIKVLLDHAEAKEWNITTKSIYENTPEVQKMFWHAIRMAKENMNFSIDGAKLFVETIPSYESGLGMLITKACTDEEFSKAVENCSYKGKLKRTELKADAQRREKRRKCIFCFESFDSVCSAVGELFGRYIGSSSLYKMNERFYLCLVPSEPISLCEAEILLPEFASRLSNSQYVHGRLGEYGALMIEDNAIEILNEYFV